MLKTQPLVHADLVELVFAAWIVGLVDRLSAFEGLLANSAELPAFKVSTAGTTRVVGSAAVVVAGEGN